MDIPPKLVTRATWLQIVAIAATRMMINTGFRFVYPFLPVFSRGLGVELTTIAGALGLRSLAAGVGPFLAILADRRGRRAGILSGLGLFIAGLLTVVFLPNFPVFGLALILTALGKAVFDPSFQAFLGDRVPYERRGRAIGVTEFAWSLSFIIGVPAMGLLIDRWGWSAPFPVLAALSAAGFLGLYRLIPRENGPGDRAASLTANLRRVFRSSDVLLLLAVGGLMSAANELLALVFGVWLEDAFGLRIAALGAAALVIGFAELGGESVVTVITDRVGKPQAIAGGLVLNALAALLLPILGRSSVGALAGLFLFYLTFEFALVSFIPMISEAAPDARATVMAANSVGLNTGRAVAALAAAPLYVAGGIAGTAAGVLVVDLLTLLALWLSARYADRGS